MVRPSPPTLMLSKDLRPSARDLARYNGAHRRSCPHGHVRGGGDALGCRSGEPLSIGSGGWVEARKNPGASPQWERSRPADAIGPRLSVRANATPVPVCAHHRRAVISFQLRVSVGRSEPRSQRRRGRVASYGRSARPWPAPTARFELVRSVGARCVGRDLLVERSDPRIERDRIRLAGTTVPYERVNVERDCGLLIRLPAPPVRPDRTRDLLLPLERYPLTVPVTQDTGRLGRSIPVSG